MATMKANSLLPIPVVEIKKNENGKKERKTIKFTASLFNLAFCLHSNVCRKKKYEKNYIITKTKY